MTLGVIAVVVAEADERAEDLVARGDRAQLAQELVLALARRAG